ncbi:HAMP domain-containing histidine kinase [Clostridium tyrobutyricum]|uniref:sensor histidine kinase n=1 Tax=Clostridium tyrobutyricum TaxID=1519 RepID=UPI001C37FABB|nr:HAMP domain-containing sensor histidine kinase [Clostridium tyrobutyricum]MBR9649206.1 HAMP domain-containing histidine kinase [Clostridium tyrobutyricum]MBV4448380.1 HAMP domain-containing histidine kinase [Clostridium tyrobutyricum]
MDIKKRLIIYNNLIIIIPFIITIIVALIFIFISSKFFNASMTYNDFKKASFVKSELLSTSKDIAKTSIDSIKNNVEFQKYLNEKLVTIDGKIIITKNSNIEFSSQDLGKIDMEKTLEQSYENMLNSIQIQDIYYSVDVFPIIFKDGSPGKAIFLVPTAVESNFFRNLIITVLITFFICFAIMSIITSYIFSMKILNPITLLKKAIKEISHGDLDFEVAEDGDEEIRELCSDFEKMRLQLKDSIRLRIKYDQNRTMLVSSISHDLKTPITSIEGYIQGILDGVANTPEKLNHYLNTINSKTKQMDAMIDDLLLYSKLDLRQLPFNYKKTDIQEYFSCCVEETRPELAKSNIEITLKNNLNNTKYFMIDRNRFMRVILNIIDNARKYMNKEFGKIYIILRETSTSIIIEIKDNGIGIKKGDINKIFNRFYRVDSARSNAKGSGLGLAIAKQIVESHKGKIWAVSNINEGTSIIISLSKI